MDPTPNAQIPAPAPRQPVRGRRLAGLLALCWISGGLFWLGLTGVKVLTLSPGLTVALGLSLAALTVGLALRTFPTCIGAAGAVDAPRGTLPDESSTNLAARTAALEASRDLYRDLIEGSQLVGFRLQGDFGFSYVSPRAERLLGRPLQAWAAPGFFREALHPNDRARIHGLCERLLSGGADAQADFRLQTADGRIVWVRGLLTGAGGGREPREVRGFLMSIVRPAQADEELQLSQKLETLGRLAAGISHEINTPVQFVSDGVYYAAQASRDLMTLLESYQGAAESLPAQTRAELAQAEAEMDLKYLVENLPRSLERASEGLDRVATIARSMKEFAHPDPKEMISVDLNRSLQTTLVIARNEYRYVAELETEFGPVGEVACFAGEINQVVLNLLINASHAVGDRVGHSGERGQIRLRTSREGDQAVIAISDTGTGIPPDIRARIFEPFFTTKPPGKGTGQGLAMAQAVVIGKHRGTIHFETEVGVGTTFFLRIPIAGTVRAMSAAA